MPIHCAVVGCSKPDVSFRIPKVIVNQGPATQELTETQRREWLKQIGRKEISFRSATYQRVCRRHFVGGKQKKGIGGRMGLKNPAILKIQGHLGAAIRNNVTYVGNVPAMKKAVWVIWEHRNKIHTNCGQWCPSKKGNEDPNKNALPAYVTAAIRQVFETLAAESLLDKCTHGEAQNTNESFHHLIWEGSPKTTFCGRARIELAVADATIVFNEGELRRRDILVELASMPNAWKLALRNGVETAVTFWTKHYEGIFQEDAEMISLVEAAVYEYAAQHCRCGGCHKKNDARHVGDHQEPAERILDRRIQPPSHALADSDEEELSFSTQGKWVATFYDETFYIGQVISVESLQSAEVQYLQRWTKRKTLVFHAKQPHRR